MLPVWLGCVVNALGGWQSVAVLVALVGVRSGVVGACRGSCMQEY